MEFFQTTHANFFFFCILMSAIGIVYGKMTKKQQQQSFKCGSTNEIHKMSWKACKVKGNLWSLPNLFKLLCACAGNGVWENEKTEMKIQKCIWSLLRCAAKRVCGFFFLIRINFVLLRHRLTPGFKVQLRKFAKHAHFTDQMIIEAVSARGPVSIFYIPYIRHKVHTSERDRQEYSTNMS